MGNAIEKIRTQVNQATGEEVLKNQIRTVNLSSLENLVAVCNGLSTQIDPRGSVSMHFYYRLVNLPYDCLITIKYPLKFPTPGEFNVFELKRLPVGFYAVKLNPDSIEELKVVTQDFWQEKIVEGLERVIPNDPALYCSRISRKQKIELQDGSYYIYETGMNFDPNRPQRYLDFGIL